MSKSSKSMDRRDFLKSMAAGGTVAITSLPVLGANLHPALASGCKFFTVPQAALIESISERMVPADANPGGKAAGVVFYIDGVLAGPFGKFYRKNYEEGLPMIDTASRKADSEAPSFLSLRSNRLQSLKILDHRRQQPRKRIFLACCGATSWKVITAIPNTAGTAMEPAGK